MAILLSVGSRRIGPGAAERLVVVSVVQPRSIRKKLSTTCVLSQIPRPLGCVINKASVASERHAGPLVDWESGTTGVTAQRIVNLENYTLRNTRPDLPLRSRGDDGLYN